MQVLNVVDHLWDNPAAIPKRQLGRLLYGVDSVFARTPRPEQVQGLTRNDIIAHLARWQRPDNAVLGVAGTAQNAFGIMHFANASSHHPRLRIEVLTTC